MLHGVASYEHAPTRSGLPGLRAPRPVGVGVDVDAVDRLLLELVDQSRCSVEVPADPLQGFPSLSGWLGHPSAYLFARELHVYAIRCKVVAPRSRASEGGGQMLGKIRVFFELREGMLDARCGHSVRAFEAAFGDEALDLPRVCLVLDAVLAPSDDAVENATFLCIARPWPKAGLDGDLIVL